MPKTSTGILMYRLRPGRPQVLLVHPGGPFWRNKDEGAWSIPKGEIVDGEDPLAAAQREFAEELGHTPSGTFVPLTPIKQKSGKVVQVWAVAGEVDTSATRSNTFTMEWPPGSKKQAEFPEVDRAEFFDLEAAKKKINPAQAALLVELEKLLHAAKA